MATASSATGHRAPPPRKPIFAKPARFFASAAARIARLPGFPLLWIVCGAAMVVMIALGPFGSDGLPLAGRSAIWGLMFGWNLFKWQCWLAATVRRRQDWVRASAVGTVLLNLPLPFEIRAAAGLLGYDAAPDLLVTWGQALVIGIAIFCAVYAAARSLHRRVGARGAPAIADTGLAARVRFDPAALVAIEAEDHYCRLRFADGSSHLVHYRFGDALADVASLDGAQVHRGAWVAAHAVAGAVRDGRRWRLRLADGSRLSVSSTYIPVARARGWLAAPVRSGVALGDSSA